MNKKIEDLKIIKNKIKNINDNIFLNFEIDKNLMLLDNFIKKYPNLVKEVYIESIIEKVFTTKKILRYIYTKIYSSNDTVKKELMLTQDASKKSIELIIDIDIMLSFLKNNLQI